ncbi:hypothetical protein BpHYR1_010058 [Brachionus plicatilis]|uniref:Uncharacterized protein n=1 Tax=Brachionus plicatilis TaxID=10195 RepID=A0A3M7PXX8_BRAPC|nr:hypothetical protein BpHYR1_010058 [Brachionus plicatilis]
MESLMLMTDDTRLDIMLINCGIFQLKLHLVKEYMLVKEEALKMSSSKFCQNNIIIIIYVTKS